MSTLTKRSKLILRISLTAMFLAFAVVSKLLLPINIPLLGAGGMKVGLAGIFTAFPAFMFGPVYGGITSALSDILGYLIKPDGAYIPWLSLTAFLGGFLKGLIWMGIVRMAKRSVKIAGRTRIITVAVLLVVGILGLSMQLTLNGDGVMNGLAAIQSDLPTRGEVEALELSPLSSLAVDLAQYNKDTITLKAASNEAAQNGTMTVPAAMNLDGMEYKITKIGANAFSECNDVKKFIIPAAAKTIDAAAFEGLSGFTIAGAADSSAAKFAEDNGIAFEVSEDAASVTVSSDEFQPDGTGVKVTVDGFTIRSSDTFRKYLAGYVNFATIGLEIVAIAGIIFVALDLILEKTVKNNASEKKGKLRFSFVMIFVAIFISGLITTTINTEILILVLEAWKGRSFMILWIPRAIEEMVVCMVQAYIISVLYGVYTSKIAGRGRFADLDINYDSAANKTPTAVEEKK